MQRLAALAALVLIAASPPSPRARDLGVPFEGQAGPLNAITDVAGVEVGHATIIRGAGKLIVGEGPVRTGVTAILPRGRKSTTPVFAGWFTLNAAGEMTGTTWIDERGLLDGPIMITNTHSVGIARDAAIKWMVRQGWAADWNVPVAAETYDGALNDINGFHVAEQHALAALDKARGGPVAEGSVGGGTGMVCSRFKGGIGTASRKLPADQGGYTVGVLVQCNYGARKILRIAGVPVGEELKDFALPCHTRPIDKPRFPFASCAASGAALVKGDAAARADGSIIIIVATDAPLLPHQLKRLAKRPSLGLGRLGSIASDGSGDIFLAFSTANPQLKSVDDASAAPSSVAMHPNDRLSPLFEAATQATEEAVINAMVAAPTMVGADGLKVSGLPHDRLRAVLAKYNRLSGSR